MEAILQNGFRTGDYAVVPRQGRIIGPDKETRVQPKIIDVLVCLAEAAGEVVSRQDLHDKVWGNVVVTDDALNRCISELRRVFGDQRDKIHYIETVPKRGYRLRSEIHALDNAAPLVAAEETESGNQPPRLENAVATVAVLPFENVTPDSANAFLADALPTALHCGIARLNRIRVSSRRSSFALRDSTQSAAEIGKQLGAQYIISGNIAEAGGRLRVIAEVDDADAGVLLWSQRYEVDSSDVLAFEQQLTEAVVGAFGGQRLRSEISRAQEGPPKQLDAWGLVQRARAYLVSYRPSALKEARRLIAEAVTKDPDYALAQAMHALLIAENVINGLSDDAPADCDAALAAVSRALKLAPSEPAVLRTVGCAQAYCGDYTSALDSLRRAVKAAPFDLGAWGYLGWPLTATGKAADLEELLSITGHLLETTATHPGAPYWQYHQSVALACAGDWQAALEPIEACLAAQPEFALGLMHYANVLGELGNQEAACKAAGDALASNPALTPARYAAIIAQLTELEAVRELRLKGLRKAGLIDR